jgi:uncharacterized membrane protein YadS
MMLTVLAAAWTMALMLGRMNGTTYEQEILLGMHMYVCGLAALVNLFLPSGQYGWMQEY